MFESQSPQTGTAQIQFGANKLPVPAGQTVGAYRRQFGMALSIPNEAKPHIGAKEVTDDYTVSAGEVVVFIRKLGEKG